MATNKRKDSAALFELIDKSTLKVPKHSGSLKIPSWWSSKSNPPSLAQPHAAAKDSARTAAEPSAFQKPIPSAVPTPPAASAAPASPQARLFEPPPADVSGTASPSIRPPVPPTGPRFAMVTAANQTDDALDAVEVVSEEPVAADSAPSAAENDAATAVMETPATSEPAAPEQELTPDSAMAGSPEGYAGLGAGRRIFAPQTMSQTDGFHHDWVSLQKSRFARTPMWAMVAGVAAILIFLVLVVYMIMPHRPAANGETQATSSSGNSGSPVAGPGASQSILPPIDHTTPAPLPANNHRSLVTAPMVDDTPGHVYEQGTVQRSADLYYIKIATTSAESIARRNADFLAKHGVDVSIETQMSRSKRLLYILISAKGFATIGDAHDLRKKIVDIGHLPPYFSSGHPAWDDAPVLKWSSLTRR